MLVRAQVGVKEKTNTTATETRSKCLPEREVAQPTENCGGRTPLEHSLVASVVETEVSHQRYQVLQPVLRLCRLRVGRERLLENKKTSAVVAKHEPGGGGVVEARQVGTTRVHCRYQVKDTRAREAVTSSYREHNDNNSGLQ